MKNQAQQIAEINQEIEKLLDLQQSIPSNHKSHEIIDEQIKSYREMIARLEGRKKKMKLDVSRILDCCYWIARLGRYDVARFAQSSERIK